MVSYFKEYDCVVMNRGNKDALLGLDGVIVHVYDQDRQIFEVEFFDANKQSVGTFTIEGKDLKSLD